MRNFKLLLLMTFIVMLALSSVLAVSATLLFAAADDIYPSKAVRIILPSAPGGSQDILGRLIATRLSGRYRKSFIIENLPGAGQVMGAENVATANPDGYTLLFAAGAHTIQPALQKLPYDPVKSFAPIALLVEVVQGLVVHPSVPANSVKEFLSLAKQKSGQLIVVTSEPGNTPHMACELFKIMANVDFKIVHFKGQGPSSIDLLGGHSHASINSLPGWMPYIRSGKLRVLGSSGLKRSVSLPDVPTIDEAGVPGYEVSTWYGILAPAGTPARIVDSLSKELKAILVEDDVKKFLLREAMDSNYLSPTEFVRYLEGQIEKWKNVVKKANIKIQ